MLRKIAFLCIPLPVFAQDTALVAAATGTVTFNKTSHVTSFEWLPEGAVLRTEAKSSAIVILLNGHRFEFGPQARATIGATGLSKTAGPVKELNPIPAIPKFAPLAIKSDSSAAGAFRGGAKMAGLCPSNGKASLAGPVIFSFEKVAGATRYQIVVEDADGNEIANEQTTATQITVSLEPGARYSWRVRAFNASGVMAGNQAGFATLSKEQVAARKAFAEKVDLALLAEVDLANGLICEALHEFREALKSKPDDPAIAHGLKQAESSLGEK